MQNDMDSGDIEIKDRYRERGIVCYRALVASRLLSKLDS
jgi:hypothetical protein